ncbi:MAG: (d)CMP kinase [Gemmatimonadales bacterium]
MSGKVIAIDGPAASGKSTTARQVAEHLGFLHVNSGLFYRVITWAALREGLIDEESELHRWVPELEIEPVVGEGVVDVRIEGETARAEEMQGRDVSAHVSKVSAYGFVRDRVLTLLREAGRLADVVCDGRDIGSVVFPNASLKIFLVADIRERARRRLLDYRVDPSDETISAEAERLGARDRADSTRERAPLIRAADAVEIDTTNLAPDAVVRRILDLAAERGLGAPTG